MQNISGRQRVASLLFVGVALAGSPSACSSSDSASGDVRLDASRIFRGSLTLTGTITLPKGAGSGKSIQLTASGGGADITKSGSVVAPAGTTPGESVPYTITGLSAGEYTVRARVDQNGDDNLSSSGDLDGQTGGTVEAPVLDSSKAKKVTVGPNGATGVDFGLGLVP